MPQTPLLFSVASSRAPAFGPGLGLCLGIERALPVGTFRDILRNRFEKFGRFDLERVRQRHDV